MMVAVHPLERFRRHSQEAGGIPYVYAALHEPCRGCVPERVWGYPFEPSPTASRGKGALNISDPFPSFVNHKSQLNAAPPNAMKMRQQPCGNGDTACSSAEHQAC
jgi:hypothetical protein